MRTALIILLIFGLGSLVLLHNYEQAMPQVLLDAIVPHRLLTESTIEERREMIERISRAATTTSYLPWIGAVFVTLVSALGLWAERNKKPDK